MRSLRRLLLAVGALLLAGFTGHASLNLPQLTLAGQQLLALLGNLALHLEFDLTELLLLTAELLLLKADGLSRKIFRVDR